MYLDLVTGRHSTMGIFFEISRYWPRNCRKHVSLRRSRLNANFLKFIFPRRLRKITWLFSYFERCHPTKIGSWRWNWQFRENFFFKSDPELLLHSSYSFWPWQVRNHEKMWKTSFLFFTFFHDCGLVKSQPLPLVDRSDFEKKFSRNFQFHRQDPILVGWHLSK